MRAKNKYGQYFTNQIIADFMVSLIDHPIGAKILEPSSGKGVFLDALQAHSYNNLFAYEIDSSLLNGKYQFVQNKSFISAPLSDKYDVIIGNPPYIRWKNLEPELKEELNENLLWNKYFNSLCDYLFIFILKSILHLNEGGELIFICTEYWLTTTNSINLRNFMIEEGYFEDIYHFSETKLFDGVAASLIIFKFIKTKKRVEQDIKLYKYKSRKFPTIDNLYQKTGFECTLIPPFQYNKRWLLADQKLIREITRLEKSCRNKTDLFSEEVYRIEEVCNIGNGMVSGLDSAFRITSNDKLNTLEKSFLIDIFKAKDLSQYFSIGVSKYIFIPEDYNFPNSFEVDCPNLYKHFSSHIAKLNNRYSYNRDIPYWSFVFARNKKMFDYNEKKIFVPCKERITNKSHFRFALVPSKHYPLQDVTCLQKKESCKESIEYLTAYLNSKEVFDWFCLNGIVKGGIVEFSEKPIASIPYRKIDHSNPWEKNIHDKITSEMKLMMQDRCEEHKFMINQLFSQLFNYES